MDPVPVHLLVDSVHLLMDGVHLLVVSVHLLVVSVHLASGQCPPSSPPLDCCPLGCPRCPPEEWVRRTAVSQRPDADWETICENIFHTRHTGTAGAHIQLFSAFQWSSTAFQCFVEYFLGDGLGDGCLGLGGLSEYRWGVVTNCQVGFNNFPMP